MEKIKNEEKKKRNKRDKILLRLCFFFLSSSFSYAFLLCVYRSVLGIEKYTRKTIGIGQQCNTHGESQGVMWDQKLPSLNGHT